MWLFWLLGLLILLLLLSHFLCYPNIKGQPFIWRNEGNIMKFRAFVISKWALLIIFILLISALNPTEFHLNDQIVAQVIAITLLLVGINIALSGLPGPLRRVVLMVTNIAKRWFSRTALWCWERIKIMFSWLLSYEFKPIPVCIPTKGIWNKTMETYKTQ